MKTQSVSKAEKLANASRTQGLWSIGVLIIPTLLVLLLGNNVVLGCLFTLLLFGSLFLGLLACSSALVAIWMNWRGSNDATIKRTATIGLVLGGIPVVIVVIIYYAAWLSVSQSI